MKGGQPRRNDARRSTLAALLASLLLLPLAAPAGALFVLPLEGDPPAGAPPPAAGPAATPAAPAAVPTPDGLGLAPEALRHPLEEVYRTSLLGPDVTRVLEARARALGLPVVEIAWTHDVGGPRPLSEALAALAEANAPGLSVAELERAQAEADRLPRDLQETLARLVWRLLDAGDLQREAFAALTAEETRALQAFDDPLALGAIEKVDVGAVLGAGRAVDQAVQEAEPVLRKWSLLLDARRSLAGRPLTEAGLAAGATQLLDADADLATGWALGLADRPRAAVPDLPEMPLSESLAVFYAVHGVPLDDPALLSLLLIDRADPSVAKPLSRSVVATTAASVLVLDGLYGPAAVDPQRFLELDREAVRIATTSGVTPEDLALLTEYARLARVIADTPALTAVELLLATGRGLLDATPRALAGPAAAGPAIHMPADATRYDLPGGGDVTIHNEHNGTYVSTDPAGTGDRVFTPATGAYRIAPDPARCRFVATTERNEATEDARDATGGEYRHDANVFRTPALCDVPNNITLMDPYGYFVVGGEGRSVYDERIGRVVLSAQNRGKQVSLAHDQFNDTVARNTERLLRAVDGNGNAGCNTFPFLSTCQNGDAADGLDLSAHDFINRGRVSNVTVNSQSYQYVTWDLGGDDLYRNNAGGTLNWTEPWMLQRFAIGDVTGPVALAVDWSGDDSYLGRRNYTIGSAQMGVGILLDREGDDRYAGPSDSVGASAGVRRLYPGVSSCSGPRECGRGAVYGDPGAEAQVGGVQLTKNEEQPRDTDGDAPVAGATVVVRKAATAFALILDLNGSDSYRGGERSIASANQSYAYVLDLRGDDRYEGHDFSQGVANNTGFHVRGCLGPLGCSGAQLPTTAVAALLDVRGNDTYVTHGRDAFSQGRGLGRQDWGGILPATAGLLLDLSGADDGIRRNGNVTVGDGLVDVGFRTRHVHRGPSDPMHYRDNRPDHGVSLALDLNVPESADPARFRGEGTYFEAPASHADMQEDPFFALDLYVDLPRLFVLGSEADTVYERDAIVLVDLGGTDRFLATVGAATFDWNATTSHDGRHRNETLERPRPDGRHYLPHISISPSPSLAASTGCRDRDNTFYACSPGTNPHGRFSPVALAISMEGSDTYRLVHENGTHAKAFGYGSGGVGALYDLGVLNADDVYEVSAMGLGAGAFFGVGILLDAHGNDVYNLIEGREKGRAVTSLGLGFAHAGGVGVAIDAFRGDVRGTDRYFAGNLSLGSVLVDFSREYAVFFDAGGSDSYNATTRSIAHAETVAFPRPAHGEFDGLMNPPVGNRRFHDAWCYYLRNANGDAQAVFVDDSLDRDRYVPAKSAWGAARGDNLEWRRWVGNLAMRGAPDECRNPPSLNPIQAQDSPNQGQSVPVPTVRGEAQALGIDNLDAYYHRNSKATVRDPAGHADRATDLDRTSGIAPEHQGAAYLPLDEVLGVRAILLSPAAQYTFPNSASTRPSNAVQGPAVPMFGDYPVGVVALRGVNSVRENADSFAGYLLRESVPRLTCSFVPHPTRSAHALGQPSSDGTRPALPGATFVPNVDHYRRETRSSDQPGYCGKAREARGWYDAPCKAEVPPVRPCTVLPVDPGTTTKPARDAVAKLELPLSYRGIPVLAEALRLAAEVEPDLADALPGMEDALAEALALVFRGDVPAAQSVLQGGLSVPLSAHQAPGNSCDPQTSTLDDCQDVGRVEFFVLRRGKLVPLGHWDNGLAADAAGTNVRLLQRADGNVYIHDWKTAGLTRDDIAFPDGPYDLLVRSYYRENGGFGSGLGGAAGGAAYVHPSEHVALTDQAYRRVHDEYGYYPGENWLNVSVDNRPYVLAGASRFGHFRPNVDDTKPMTLTFTEPASVELRLSRANDPVPALATQATAAWRPCQPNQPNPHRPLLHGYDSMSMSLPTATLGQGVYWIHVKPRDCTPDAQRPDGRTWANWEFVYPVVGDLDAPVADLLLDRDHLNAGDLVPCPGPALGGAARCVTLDLQVDRLGRTVAPGEVYESGRVQSPIDQYHVTIVERRAAGDVTLLPNRDTDKDTDPAAGTTRVPRVTFEVVHGATYEIRVKAVDEAGNAQAQETVRSIVFDEFPPRVGAVQTLPTMHPDGVAVVHWTLESADPVFLGDAAGVLVEWATGPVPAQGVTPERVWRPLPPEMLDAAAATALVNATRLLERYVLEETNESKLENTTRMHFENLTDGYRLELRMRAYDVRGNLEGTNMRTGEITKRPEAIRFDTVPPNLTDGPSLKILHDRLEVGFELSEPGSATIRFGTAGSDLGRAVATTPSGNGTTQRVTLVGLAQATDHEFRIVARDVVGNTRVFPENGTYAFSTDRVVTVGILAPAEGAVVSGPARIQWRTTDHRVDPYVSYQLKLSVDGGKTFPHNLTEAGAPSLYERTSPARSFVFDSRLYPDSAEAVVRVLANNSLNRGTPLAFDSPVFRIDNAPPRTVATLLGEGNLGWYRTAVVLRLDATDRANVSEVTRLEWSRDNRTWTTVDGAPTTTLEFGDEGRYTVFFRAVDTLGHAEPTRHVTFAVDRSVPEGTLVVEGGALATRDRRVQIEIGARDDLSGVASVVLRTTGVDPLTVPGERLRGGAFVQDLDLPGDDGDKILEITVQDVAGNRNVLKSTIRLDTTAPDFEEVVFDRVAFQTATGTARLSEAASLVVFVKRAQDVGYQGRVEYGDPTTSHRVTLTGLQPSTTYNLRIVATDLLGNTREHKVDLRTLEDLVAPTQPQSLAARDEGYGAVALQWAPAQDNVGVDHYRVSRAAADEGTPAGDLVFEPVGIAYRNGFLDGGIEAGVRYAYRVTAVDAAGNDGPASSVAYGRASTRPVLSGGGVSPPSGSVAETFTYSINYRDDDGDAPAFVRVYIDGEVHDMVRDRAGVADYREGVRYVYRTILEPTRLSTGVHTFRYEASDGRSVVQFPPSGLDAVVGPAVFGDPGDERSASTLAAAIREVPLPGLLGLLAAVGVAAGAAVAFRRRWGP